MELEKADTVLDKYIQNEPIAAPIIPPSDEENINDYLSDSSVSVSLTPVEKSANSNSVAKEIDARNKQETKDKQEAKNKQEELQENRLATLDAITALNDSNPIAGVADKIGNSPTPGGIGLLLVSIILFVWIIVPVDNSGNTRLKLIWLTLTGHTRLKEEYRTAETNVTDVGNSNIVNSAPTNSFGNGGSSFVDYSLYDDVDYMYPDLT